MMTTLRFVGMLAAGSFQGSRTASRLAIAKSPPMTTLMNTSSLAKFQKFSLLRMSSLRYVHNTKKKYNTTLVTSEKNSMAFHKMSLTSLRNECRSRGLKVSGRKAELVARVSSHHGLDEIGSVKIKKSNSASKKRTVHTSSKTNNELSDQMVTPEISVRTMSSDSTVAQQAEPDSSKIFKNMSQSGFAKTSTVTNKTTNGTGNVGTIESEITTRDMFFFYGFATAVGIWWSLQYSFDDKRELV